MTNRAKAIAPRPRRTRSRDVTDALRAQPAADGQPRQPVSACRIILGGHSFIAPLGRDAEPSAAAKQAIVSACLRLGVDAFDTTYAPERSAFATALGDRPAHGSDDAMGHGPRPILWNFFGRLTDPLPSAEPWTESRWAEATSELAPWRGRPLLVVHAVDDPAANRLQVATAARWKREGRIGALGAWPGSPDGWSDDHAPALDFVVAPWNVASAGATTPAFLAARARGLITVGTSPFTRGWELDRLAKRLAIFEQRPVGEARARVADALLRFAAFAPEVDHVIVAMRSAAYVADNFASLARGPLTPHERRWLDGLTRTAALKDRR